MKSTLKIFRNIGVPVVVTLNSFVTDTDAEMALCEEILRRNEAVNLPCPKYGKKAAKAASRLAEKVLDTLENKEEQF